MGGRVAHDHDSVVVRHVQPLVRVGGPRIRKLGAIEQGTAIATGTAPQSECSIDMQPCSAIVRDVREIAQRIDGAGVHVSRLGADDRRSTQGGERPAQTVGAHPSLFVRVDDVQLAGAEAEESQRRIDRDVRLGADHHVDRRGAGHPLLFHVVTGASQDRIALGTLTELFPDRSVVGIHAVDLIWGLGTLHCLTQQQPA